MTKINTKLPLVSVAIITYNQKSFLEECIESVLTQDYANLEIVVADDGSTDGTNEMLLQYQVKYPDKFIIKLAEQNQGITKNCNLAHFACSGKYIAWMGGDDIMLPGKISKQTAFMELNTECKISYHNVEVFNSETGKLLSYFNNRTNSYEGDISRIIKFGAFFCASATMVRRENTPVNGYDERIPVASDWLYWVECLADGGKINYLNDVLGKYRKHNYNISGKQSKSFAQIYLDSMNSASIVLYRYPQFLPELTSRFSSIFRESRKINDASSYHNFLIASLKMHFSLKSFVLLIIWIVSFGYKKI